MPTQLNGWSLATRLGERILAKEFEKNSYVQPEIRLGNAAYTKCSLRLHYDQYFYYKPSDYFTCMKSKSSSTSHSTRPCPCRLGF
jgi:hypothetical protein